MHYLLFTGFILLLCIGPFWLNAQRIEFLRDDFRDIQGDTVAEKTIFDLVNYERAKSGLQAVQFDRSLRSAARQHAQEMLKLGYFSHTSPVKECKEPVDRVYRSGLTDFAVGENIALHSVNGSSAVIADKFMDQWMNSPGHKANILKPEFNAMGAGVISFVDSVVLDTIIRGQKQRTVILTIKHYGAQVFADRDYVFTELFLEKRNTLVLNAEIRFNIDRDILVQIGNLKSVSASENQKDKKYNFYQTRQGMRDSYYLLLQKPEGTGNWVRLIIPYEKPVSVQFSLLWNSSTNTYVPLLNSSLDYLDQDLLHKALDQSPIRISRKKIFFEQSDLWFLKGKATVINKKNTTKGVVQTGDNEYYEFPLSIDLFEFSVPVLSVSKKINLRIGLGDDKETAVKHQVFINGKALKKLKPNEAGSDKTAAIVFSR